MRVFCTPVDRWCRGAALSLDWKPTPYFSFCLSTRAARIQTSVWLHTLFSGEPVEIQPFNTLLPLRPVREQRAGRGGDFSFWSDLIFLQPSPLFSSFTRLTDFGVVKSARRCSQSHASLFFCPCAAPPWQWIDFSVFFSDLCLDQVEKTVSLTCGSLSSYMFHPASFKSTWLQMFLHILGLWTFFFFLPCAFSGGGRGF